LALYRGGVIQSNAVEAKLDGLLRDDAPSQRLLSVPGMGPRTAEPTLVLWLIGSACLISSNNRWIFARDFWISHSITLNGLLSVAVLFVAEGGVAS
jgi:hypothetical protein